MFEQTINKQTGELHLVKRPSSFRTSLQFAGAPDLFRWTTAWFFGFWCHVLVPMPF